MRVTLSKKTIKQKKFLPIGNKLKIKKQGNQ